jgi:N-acetylmuramoyl-L-alanine amidase
MTIAIRNCPVNLPLKQLKPFVKNIIFIAVHCSATPPSMPNIGAVEIDKMHRQRSFACIGYHYVIKRDGTIERGRPINTQGAHIEGYNSVSLGICLIGGVDDKNRPVNNYTPEQFIALKELILTLQQTRPFALVLGHRDFSPDKNHDGVISPNEYMKACPCFDVREWMIKNQIPVQEQKKP